MKIYRISINLIPEIIGGTPMYFWCILGQQANCEVNCGHGWASSILYAAKEAKHYYETRINLNDSSTLANDTKIMTQKSKDINMSADDSHN